MGDYVNKPFNNIVGWSTVAALVILSLLLLITKVLEMF